MPVRAFMQQGPKEELMDYTDFPFIQSCKQFIRDKKNHSWTKVQIGKSYYYGKNLEGKHWEKTKIVVGKIIPLFLLSVLILPIPLLFASRAYQKLGQWIRQVHYNSTLDYKIGETKATNPVPFPDLEES